jgi:hypothetical protein
VQAFLWNHQLEARSVMLQWASSSEGVFRESVSHLTRQHTVIATVFKVGASSVCQPLAGY